MRVLVLAIAMVLLPVYASSQGEKLEYIEKNFEKHGLDPTKRVTDDDFLRLLNEDAGPAPQKNNAKKKPQYRRSDYRQVVDFLIEHQVDPAILSNDKLKKAFLQ